MNFSNRNAARLLMALLFAYRIYMVFVNIIRLHAEQTITITSIMASIIAISSKLLQLPHLIQGQPLLQGLQRCAFTIECSSWC